MTPSPQHQYITNWHDSFVGHIGSLLSEVAGLMARPEATEEDKRGLDSIRLILNRRFGIRFTVDYLIAKPRKETVIQVFNNFDKANLATFLFGVDKVKTTRVQF